MIVTPEQRLQLIAAALTGIMARSYHPYKNDGASVADNAIYYADMLICKLRREDIGKGGETNAAQTEALEPE